MLPSLLLRTGQLAAIALFLSFFACTKEKSEQCTVNTTNLAGTYLLTDLKYKAHGTAPEEDYYALMEPCEKDDPVTLHANGSWTANDEHIRCTPDGGTDSGTWTLTDGTIISDGLIAGRIQNFDCRTLIIYIDELNMPGDRLIYTMTKQ